MSGHVFFKERWHGFDDGLYAGARMLEILSRVVDIEATLNNLPDSLCTPEILVPMAEGEAHQLLARLHENAHFEGACKVVTIDGLRVEYPEGFGLMRASNTTPALMMRFEANDAESLIKIQTLFKINRLAASQLLVLPI